MQILVDTKIGGSPERSRNIQFVEEILDLEKPVESIVLPEPFDKQFVRQRFVREILNFGHPIITPRYMDLLNVSNKAPEYELPHQGREEETRILAVYGMIRLEKAQKGLGTSVWRFSKNTENISRKSGSGDALANVYGSLLQEHSDEAREWTNVCLGVLNGRDVRNRERHSEYETTKALLEYKPRKGETFNILSIAAGAGLDVFRGVAGAGLDSYQDVNITLVDNSSFAKRMGEAVAARFGLSRNVDFQLQDALDTHSYLPFTPHYNCIKIIGFADYPKRHEVVELVADAEKSLKPGGSLEISNIRPNDEQELLNGENGNDGAMRWLPMEYRPTEELEEMIIEAGFSRKLMKTFVENCGIYTYIKATKTA